MATTHARPTHTPLAHLRGEQLGGPSRPRGCATLRSYGWGCAGAELVPACALGLPRRWQELRGALPAFCRALAGLTRSHRLLAQPVRLRAPFLPPNPLWVCLLTPPAQGSHLGGLTLPPCPPWAPGASPGLDSLQWRLGARALAGSPSWL